MGSQTAEFVTKTGRTSSSFVSLLEVSLLTADRFGRIAAALRKKGMPIPTNDIWIAAHAMQSGAELLSYDAHFARIDGLVWSTPESLAT